MYTQTMAARFDCKKLLRFALATLCLLALAMFMPVAARAEETDKSKETGEWKAQNENDSTLYATFERNGTATETDLKQGKVNLEVYVMKPGKVAYSENSDVDDYYKYTTTFNYQYNAYEDNGLTFHEENKSFDQLPKTKEDPKGTGKGGYGSLDLEVTAGEGYTIYRVDYTVCYSSGGPTKTGWKTEEFNVKQNETGPMPYCYLDNIQDGTTATVYLMPTYTVQYKVIDENGSDANTDTYSVADGKNLNDVTVLPYKGNFNNINSCNVLGETSSYEYNKGSIAPYHRWCSAANEENAVNIVKNALNKYNNNTSVTLPKLAATDGYSVSAWTHNGKEYSGTLDLSELSATEFEALAGNTEKPLTITLTAVVKAKQPEGTEGSGDSGSTGGNGGNTDGDNTGSGDGSTSGGQESTPTPTPETTPTSTSSVTTVTAVAPTATPTATPAPTAEPTATPAPAAVSAHIPQTSDDMPYTLLVVTALASLCAAGALFMKRRSK